jgi:hypothetical protein
LGKVAFWGNLILFFSKKKNPLTNLISFFPREIVHFLLKKLFPLFIGIFVSLRGMYLKITLCLLLLGESPILGASSLKEVT